MEMIALICLAICGFIIASLIMPWVINARVKQLEAQLFQLANQFRAFKAQQLHTPLSDNPFAAQQPVEPIQVQAPVPPRPAYTPVEPPVLQPMPPQYQANFQQPKAKATRQAQQSSFEWQFGLRLPVWIGGIALALAGFYLVKYSIETGLLSPLVRVILGVLFGGALIGSAEIINQRVKHDAARVTQSLCGAGIAVLYASIFSATSLFHLIEPVTGFVAMAAITFGAVTLSLKHGAAIAVLGMCGGFLTPALIGSDSNNTPLLFTYLYAVLTGLLVVIRQRNWWALSCVMIVGAYLWVAAWLLFFYDANDALWVGLFILGVTLNSVLATHKARRLQTHLTTDQPLAQLNYLAVAGALVLLGSILHQSYFDWFEFTLFGLLSVGSLTLAFYDQATFKFAPFASLIANIILLSLWDNGTPDAAVLVCVAYGALYGLGGYAFLRFNRAPVMGTILSGLGTVMLFVTAYSKLHSWNQAYDVTSNVGWGLIAFGLAAAYLGLTRVVFEDTAHDAQRKQAILATTVSTTTAFLSLALAVSMPQAYWPIALSLEIAALSWINAQLPIKALRTLAAVLTGLFSLILIPQFLLLAELILNSLTGTTISAGHVPFLDNPFLYVGVPALLFGLASIQLRKQQDDGLVAVFESLAIALAALSLYYITRGFFGTDQLGLVQNKVGFTQRGIMTNLFFAGSLACAYGGLIGRRPVLNHASVLFMCMALFRVVYFDLLLSNPLWTHDAIKGIPLLSTLVLAYGLPVAWLISLRTHIERLGLGFTLKALDGLSFVLLFTLLSLNVRFAYQGAYLDGTSTSTAEIYTYSAIWLLSGVGLLLAGTWLQDRAIRIASLGLMLLTIGKVFLYDASELTGLLRVFSFLGLGLTLIALSWFYTRFVFNTSSSDPS